MAKLIRDRSTTEKDQWWSEVSRAAKLAPKLTYEREFAPMTNTDELIERAADSLEFLESTGGGKRVQAQVIRDLTAALREARRRIVELEREWDFAINGADRLRKRLAAAKDGTDKAIELIQRWGCDCEPQIGFLCGPCRAVGLIDAAMGGEAQTHD